MPDFSTRLARIQADHSSVLCVGLDPDPARLPTSLTKGAALPDATLAFNRAIIEATAPYACAFKLNFAFFEVLGREGWRVLEETIHAIPDDLIVIADAKRGDIGNSARFYATSVFEHLNCDAITVAPYMGTDAVRPFLAYPDKAAFILGRTSNPGSADFQERMLGDKPLYLHVAERVAAWDREMPGMAGLVVGATSPEALATIRATCPTLPFLIPGVGAQGGDPRAVMQAACTPNGAVIINSSRQILYASPGPDFASAAEQAAASLRQQLFQALQR